MSSVIPSSPAKTSLHTRAAAVRVYEDFRQIPGQIFESSDPDSLFCTRPWLEVLTANGLDPKEKVRLYAVQDDTGAPLCLFPCRFEDRELSPLANYYSSFYSPVLADGADAGDVLPRFVQFIRQERPAWDTVNLRPMDPESEEYNTLDAAFRSAGFVTQRYFLYGNLYLEVAGRSYADYLKGLSSVITNNLKRANKQLLQTGRARVEVIRSGPEVGPAVEAYEKVYQNSWKKDEARPEFIRELVHMCAKQGWLRLGVVYLDGEPAAAQIWITRSGTSSIYKVAYDERFAKLSLGTVLTAHLMQIALDEDRVSCVDFLSGDDEYKKRWMSHRRERWGLLAMNTRTPKGLMAVARNVGGGWVKSMLGNLKQKKQAEPQKPV
ncbi:MAG TPA: GNAT family N-acetyltransferase [Terriglobales bacterium]|nr:GNAT family N-acetyltransferase [Terriglobales bacterium]